MADITSWKYSRTPDSAEHIPFVQVVEMEKDRCIGDSRQYAFFVTEIALDLGLGASKQKNGMEEDIDFEVMLHSRRKSYRHISECRLLHHGCGFKYELRE